MLHGQFCACVGSGRSLGKCHDGWKGCWGKKTKSTGCPPWPVDQTQITKIWYLYLPRLFNSPFCTGAPIFSGLCTLSSCAPVLQVLLASSKNNFACVVVATVTINKLSFHHCVPLDGLMPGESNLGTYVDPGQIPPSATGRRWWRRSGGAVHHRGYERVCGTLSPW